MGDDEPSPLVTVCAAHGLRYDPALHAGCVVCRREARAADESTAVQATHAASSTAPSLALCASLVLVSATLIRGNYGPWLVSLVSKRLTSELEASVPPRESLRSTPENPPAVDPAPLAPHAGPVHAPSADPCAFRAPGSGSTVANSQWPQQGLSGAAVRGELTFIDQVARAGLPVDAMEGTARTPLLWAILAGQQEAALRFVDRGADVNARDKDGATPLILTARANLPELAERLLAAGAAVEAKDGAGRTALMHAARENRPDVMSVLLARNASLEQRCARGMTALAHAAEASGCVQALGRLLDAGAQVDARDARGATPFLIALHAGHERVARKLVEAGARRDARDDDGYGPLDYVVVPRRNPSRELEAALDATLTWLLADGADRRLGLDPDETPILFRNRLAPLVGPGSAQGGRATVVPSPPRPACVRLFDGIQKTPSKELRSWLWMPTYAWRAFARAIVSGVAVQPGQRFTLAGNSIGRESWYVDDVLVIEALRGGRHAGSAFAGREGRVVAEEGEAARLGRASWRFAAEELDLSALLSTPSADRYVFTALDHGDIALLSELHLCAHGADAASTIRRISVDPADARGAHR